ncbi:MAG TPA: glycosyltransferase family 2 protein [Paludibacteraceae bacterium]|nr:glycosyltransferase family 2 protein [Paludibacteraceae bacterium]HOL00482.1 glycosyltransferase family 2 protein [Paludibacteraceae bacterium]HPO67128.1 glycosyltransferase family 2 protein [Paludibacteraceae bacterium]
MLSILIPTYNYNVTSLVKELHNQAINLYIDFEIIVMEDGSQYFVEENENINKLTNCRHIILEENIGRAAVRNKLAEEAKYDHLLFLDCDAKICSEHFIEKYLVFCKETSLVVIGGRIYEQENNLDNFSLMRKYGIIREQNTLENLKNRKKYPVLTTPNFLISKELFLKTKFDEIFSGYGHEDTIFGIKLVRNEATFFYIDNPVVHIGLETNEKFIKKTENGLKNLYNIYLSADYPEIKQLSKVLSIYLKINKIKLSKIFCFIYKHFNQNIKKRLIYSLNPSLFLFDFYKLLFLCDYSFKNDKMTE